MKHALRTGLAAAVAATALAVAVSPAVAANAKPDQPAKSRYQLDTRASANPKQINTSAYNRARSLLAHAGSMMAAKSHPIHGVSSVAVHYGTDILAESRDEFRALDASAPIKRSGMSMAHWDAIRRAAEAMGITRW
ncbi:hypothetical protein EST92_04290 [Streptomyces sp. TM32]|uniref:hypothetical protein n=1 Tax=Streptomyces sp. TM32 TaxID=1652669 RepID=UPI001010FEBF|nr:hypothetical protein [Streptomyces sp. TM32]RXS86961.1 hypothetical protein EST92_04290 [Streptomyces sp. TM32]